MALVVESRVYVPTPSGEREIQLCLGDITALPMEDKVDVICVSCFLGDYAPTHTSVLGALLRNLGINVEKLSRKKKEDLRHQFNCWIADIPQDRPDIPYETLLCFEKSTKRVLSGDSPYSNADAVKEIFRAMMPIFNNKNKSVITPLLATGDQGSDKASMLRSMVRTAIEWMRIGLPLQTLKIVLYGRVDRHGNFGMRTDTRDCIETFKKCADYVVKRSTPDTVSISKDVYLIYNEEDKDIFSKVTKAFKQKDKSFTIVSKDNLNLKEGAEEFGVFNVMRQCHRVVPLITRNFLSDGGCLDQYNIALCVNRYQRRPVLAPLCLERGLVVPVYMSLVQWINVRPPTSEKIAKSCHSIKEHIDTYSGETNWTYDVFISYSHRNLSAAQVFVDSFKRINKDLKVFFDYESLKTGYSWQQTLFKALDNSRCVIALLSPDYLASPVCNEEFNIALAKYSAKDKRLELLPVIIEDCAQLESRSLATPKDATKSEMQEFATSVCTAISDWANTNRYSAGLFAELEIPLDYTQLCETYRKLDFEKNYKVLNGEMTSTIEKTDARGEQSNSNSAEKIVYLSHALRDQKTAFFLSMMLRTSYTNFQVIDKVESEAHAMEMIEKADCIVVVLSPNYQKSTREVEELNLALSRQRAEKERQLVYCVILDTLGQLPTYFNLIHCQTSLVDYMWKKLAEVTDHADLSDRVKIVQKDTAEKFDPVSDAEALPLMKVCYDVGAIVNKNRPAPQRPSGGILGNVATLQKEIEEFFTKYDNGTDEVAASSKRGKQSNDVPKQHCERPPTPQHTNCEDNHKTDNTGSVPHGENSKSSEDKRFNHSISKSASGDDKGKVINEDNDADLKKEQATSKKTGICSVL